ncbi:Translation initiation factor IF-2 [Dirofilaria immitis]
MKLSRLETVTRADELWNPLFVEKFGMLTTHRTLTDRIETSKTFQKRKQVDHLGKVALKHLQVPSLLPQMIGDEVG